MDDARQQTSRPRAAAAGKRSIITPAASIGPRRLAFRIRRRGFTFEGSPSLLISDLHGVWSVTHRRYIRKTRLHRFHDLKKELGSIRKQVWSYKMERWPEYTQDEEIRSLRRKLADLYWDMMPEETKARIVLFYGRRRQQRRRLLWFAAAVVLVAVVGFVLLSLVLRGFCSLRVSLLLGLGYLGAVRLLDDAAVQYGI